jgi:hypothetical protein
MALSAHYTTWLDAHPAPEQPGVRRSVSDAQIVDYLKCPWSYKLRHVEHARSKPSEAALLEQALIWSLEAYHQEPRADRSRLGELFRENGGKPEHEHYLDTYLAAEQQAGAKPHHLGEEFSIPLGLHTLRGYVPRIDRLTAKSYAVILYDASANAPTDAAKIPLLALYAVAAAKELSLPITTMTVLHVPTGKRISAPWDAAATTAFTEYLQRVIEVLAADTTFTADTTSCASCDFQSTCELAA